VPLSTSITLAVVGVFAGYISKALLEASFREFGVVVAGRWYWCRRWQPLTLYPVPNVVMTKKKSGHGVNFGERTEPFQKKMEKWVQNPLTLFNKARRIAWVILL